MKPLKLSFLLILIGLGLLLSHAKTRKTKNTSQPSKERNNDKNPTWNDNEPTQEIQDSGTVINSIAIQPSAKENQRHEDEKNYWKEQIRQARILSRVTGGAALIGLVGLYFVWDQAKTARTNAQIALDQLHTSQRPWVGIVDPVIIETPLTFDKDTASITLKATLKNFGNSPANAVDIFANVVIGQNLEEIRKRQADVCSSTTMFNIMKNVDHGSTLFPGQEALTPLMPARIPWDQIKINNDGTTSMWWVGCILYSDQFGQEIKKSGLFYYFTPFEFKPHGIIEGRFRRYLMGNPAS